MSEDSSSPGQPSQTEKEAAAPPSLPGEDSRPAQSELVVSREVAGETILVPIKSSTKELDDIFTLNEVASRIWDLIDGERTAAGIATIIASEYDVAPEDALTDTRELIARFAGAGVITIKPEA